MARSADNEHDFMTTAKQFAANLENGKKSTGPKTEAGKRRSRRNAFRHGLTAETVIEILEDRAGYKALASRIHADYRPASNFELELVARLVSLCGGCGAPPQLKAACSISRPKPHAGLRKAPDKSRINFTPSTLSFLP